MTNPNKAELRRVAHDASESEMGWLDAERLKRFMVDEWADFVAAANPDVVLSLLDSEAQAKCEAGHAIQQKDAAYAECKALRAERDAALAELEALRIQVSTLTEWYSNALDVISEVTAAIPGVTYMDPPDGGDVSIPEQIRRMAKDAKRYLWLRTADWWSSQLCVVRDPKQQAKPGTDCPSRDRLDSAIDAAMSQEANHA